MNQKRYTFVQAIRFLLFTSLILFAVVVIISQVVHGYHLFNIEAANFRAQYIESNRALIKQQVEHVTRSINWRSSLIENRAQEQVKQRVTEAHDIAQYIYQQNFATKSDVEIQKLIIDALRPIRFAKGNGYFFIIHFDGVEVLFADKPELEGINMLSVQDSKGKYVSKDLIEIAKTRGEGSYDYYWTKPNSKGAEHQKTSYIKAFEPYQWAIGTGLYLEDVDRQLQVETVDYVNEHRFGENQQGYVFVIELVHIDGGDDFGVMYANPNTPSLIGQHISDSFQDAMGKMFRKEALDGLRKDGECYVDYWYKKLDNDDPHPKTTFFKLTEDRRFIVAAGVYMDDIESGVLVLQENMRQKMRAEILKTALAASILFILIFSVFHIFSQKLLADFSRLFKIFQHAAHDNETIDRNKIIFRELFEIAGDANIMLRDKMAAQNRLLDEKNQLAVTLHSIADAVIAVDHEGRITLMNYKAENICNWKESEAIGKPVGNIFEIFCERINDQDCDPVGMALKNGVIVSFNQHSKLRSSKGQLFDIEACASPIKASDGSIQGVVLVFRDITDQLLKEQDLFRSRKLESVGVLAGGIAHDFNNLLTSLFGNIQMAQKALPADHISYEHLQHTEQSMENATNLTKQLLTFAKGGDPVKATLAIGETIAETAQFSLRGSNVKLVLDFPEDLALVDGDKGQLSQVISNLVINSKQAMPEGGTVFITAQNVDRVVVITIRDEGQGIAPQNLVKVFDPYFTTKSQGNGLGLASSYSIIEKHNGSITVTSEVGSSTTFTITLPVSTMKMVEKVGKVRAEDHRPIDNVEAKILVLDDEKSVLRVMVKMLEHLGHTVTSATSGQEALGYYKDQLSQNSPFDLVITDLTIPGGMGGQKTAEEILKIHPQAKLIVASGYATDPILGQFRKYGFLGRVAKPYKMIELQNAVREALKDHNPSDSPS